MLSSLLTISYCVWIPLEWGGGWERVGANGRRAPGLWGTGTDRHWEIGGISFRGELVLCTAHRRRVPLPGSDNRPCRYHNHCLLCIRGVCPKWCKMWNTGQVLWRLWCFFLQDTKRHTRYFLLLDILCNCTLIFITHTYFLGIFHDSEIGFLMNFVIIYTFSLDFL